MSLINVVKYSNQRHMIDLHISKCYHINTFNKGEMGSDGPKKRLQNANCMTDYSLFEKCLGIYFTISKKWKIPIFGKPNPIPHLIGTLEDRPKHFCEMVSSTEKKRVSLHRRNHDCCVSSLNAGSARCSLHSTWL